MEQENKKNELNAKGEPERYATPEIDDAIDADDAPTEWVPTRFEKRVNAIPEGTWTLMQIGGGALIGTFTVFALFQGGTNFSPLFWVAIALALLFPNVMEARGRRSLMRLRIALIITIAVGMAAVLLYKGLTQGWDFLSNPGEAAAMYLGFTRL